MAYIGESLENYSGKEKHKDKKNILFFFAEKENPSEISRRGGDLVGQISRGKGNILLVGWKSSNIQGIMSPRETTSSMGRERKG